MVTQEEEWRPGSFTKNFSWGDKSGGLIQLTQPHGNERVEYAFTCGKLDYRLAAEFRGDATLYTLDLVVSQGT